MRSHTFLALAVFLLGTGVLAGCSSTSSDLCCVPGSKPASTQAACRCGPTCLWPPERGTLEEGEVQLTPSLNKVFCCPTFRDRYRYTRAPFECVETDRRYATGR